MQLKFTQDTEEAINASNRDTTDNSNGVRKVPRRPSTLSGARSEGEGELDKVPTTGDGDTLSNWDNEKEKDKSDQDWRSQYSTRPSSDVPEIAWGKYIVGWDGPDDPYNPKNWPIWKKLLTTALISLDTTSLYMGAAIVTAAEESLKHEFGTTRVKTALGITLFVWGYGLGCLWWSPMSEIPIFRGRNPTYLGCQLVFAALQIPTALSTNVASYAVLRFLGGIFASPPLATAGATITDIWDMPASFIALLMWEFGTVAGPFVGPLIGAALEMGRDFRYIFWFMLGLSAGFFILMLLFLPETSEQELLIRKARRLRKETGSDEYIAPGEILMHQQNAKDILKDMFFKPIKLTIMEPVVALMDVHIGLVYSVMYLYLEALPIVYLETYGFNLVEMGATFLAFLVGEAIAGLFYLFYVLHNVEKMHPEKLFSQIAILGAVLLPSGLLVWGWLSRADIHWAIGMIGHLFFGMSSFLMFQSYFAFLAVMFPASAVGSAFASNNIVRSLMGGAFPLFGHPFYKNLATENYPVGWGCSILALAGILMIPLPIYLYIKGEKLKEYAQRKYGDKLLR